MSLDCNIDQDVKDLISDIRVKQNLPSTCTVAYGRGSESGDGYLSKVVAVSLIDENESLELFVKHSLNVEVKHIVPFEKLYENEMFFYEVVHPILSDFQERKNVDCFRNVPRCYGTSKKNIVALENLRKKGFTLSDKNDEMNDKHIALVFKILARFHAVSFALKDQEKRSYERIEDGVNDIIETAKSEEMKKARNNSINSFLDSLDPVEDKHILNGCRNLGDIFVNFFNNAYSVRSEYSVLIQGDCWRNNVMFLYENGNKEDPSDAMLIDWQMIRMALPVYDLSFFFYTIASKDQMDNLNYFLKVYHDELSKQIRKFGNDPEICYPYAVLEEHWKEHGKYGFAMSFLNILLILANEEDQLFNFENFDFSEDAICYPKIKNQDEYIRRLRAIAEHFVTNDFL